jgi:anti-sigma factor RsiW
MLPFAKTPLCPAAELLDAYVADRLPPLNRTQVSAHLDGCDFCSAAIHLLTRHDATADAPAPPAPPTLLVLLAAQLLPQDTQADGAWRQRAA